MLRGIAFALIFIGVSMQLPSKVESYKKYKSIDNLLEMLAYLLIALGSFLLALGYIFG
ncbi:hypothetical protein [Fenollaria sporofastidiosus]|uniref:hypothetical protein n=1 Tax=Fenollaria sporofastidiosus TaxID=2811778 RepID=UPI001C0077C3|nr:hypothetical protein [Fenollaria sporofastidiosus]